MSESCAQLEESLAALAADGESSPKVESHLAACEPCLARLDRMRTFARDLEAFDDVVPGLETTLPASFEPSPRFTGVRVLMFAAALLLFAFTLWTVTRPRNGAGTSAAQNWEQPAEAPDVLFRPQRRLTLTLDQAEIDVALREVFGPFGLKVSDYSRDGLPRVSLRLKDATMWEAYDALLGAGKLAGVAFGFDGKIVGAPNPNGEQTRRAVVGDARIGASVTKYSGATHLYLTAEFPPFTRPVKVETAGLRAVDAAGLPMSLTRVRRSFPMKNPDGVAEEFGWEEGAMFTRGSGEFGRLEDHLVLEEKELAKTRTMDLRGTFRVAYPIDPRNHRRSLAAGETIEFDREGTHLTFKRDSSGLTVKYEVPEPKTAAGGLWVCIQTSDGRIVEDLDNPRGRGGQGFRKSGEEPVTVWVTFYDSVEWVELPFELKGVPLPKP